MSAPAVAHAISVGPLQDWLECSDKTPREQALKHRLRGILDGSGETAKRIAFTGRFVDGCEFRSSTDGMTRCLMLGA